MLKNEAAARTNYYQTSHFGIIGVVGGGGVGGNWIAEVWAWGSTVFNRRPFSLNSLLWLTLIAYTMYGATLTLSLPLDWRANQRPTMD